MNVVRVNTRQSVTNYKHESSIKYMESYINLDRITQVLIMGTVARIVFSGIEGDYVDVDVREWDRVRPSSLYE